MSQVVRKTKNKKKIEDSSAKHPTVKHEVKVRRQEVRAIAPAPSGDSTTVLDSSDTGSDSIVSISRVKTPSIMQLIQGPVLRGVVEPSAKEPKLSHVGVVKKRLYPIEIKLTRPKVIRIEKTQDFDGIPKVCNIGVKEPSIKTADSSQRKSSTSPYFTPPTYVKRIPFITDFEARRITVEPKEVRPRIEKEERVTDVIGERVQKATAVSQIATEDLKKELEVPDLMRLLLGEAGEVIAWDKPVCILVEKSPEELHRAIATVCRDLFRERVGGKPTPVWKENLGKLLEEWRPHVEGKVIVVEDFKIKIDNNDEQRKLEEILKCFFSQDYGFLIIVTEDPKGLKRQLEILLPSVSNQIIVADCSKLVELKYRDPHLLKRLLRIISGNKLSVENVEVMQLGEVIKTAIEYFDDYLIKEYLNPVKALRNYPELAEQWHKVLASRLDSSNETDEIKLASKVHSALKALIWIHEWRRNKGEAKIMLEECEEKCDVCVKIGGKCERFYEVETLFGVGDILYKLMEKMEKYKKRKDAEIIFAFRNIDILRHLRLLYLYKRFWNKKGYRVEIVGFDLDKAKPIDFKEFLQLTNSLLSYFSFR